MRGHRVRAFILVASLLFPLAAHAEGPCIVRLVDPGGAHPWHEAVEAAARAVAGNDSGDCADILVTPEHDGAMVTFTTRDGRVAQRHIRRPSELRPLVDALTVTVPAMPALPPPPPEPVIAETTPDATLGIATARDEETATSLVDPAVPANADRATDTSAKPFSLVAFAAGGARTSGRADVVAPQAQLGLGIVMGSWQLDVIGRVEAERDVGTSTASGTHAELSSVGGGARASRRTRIGSFVLVSGVSLAVQYASIEARRAERHREENWVEPRAGAFVGLVGPRIGRFRVRGEILGELALAERAGTAELPATGGWGLGAMIGLETSFLP